VGLTMAERRAVTKTMAKRYRQASRIEKTTMLDELCALTGWTRDHARRALRVAAATGGTPPARAPRARIYGEDVAEPLRMIWATLNGPSGKRLAPFMAEIVEALERHGEIELTSAVRDKLLVISAATIDRLLAPERARLQIKGRSGTKPGTLLKRQIPIRTFADWDDLAPGFCEVDLVAHDGGNPAGEFCQTLDLTCVATGWTEMRALRNKAQRWCFEALMDIEATLPFPLLGLDSDNGSEFINAQLYTWCVDHEITFTRSRPQRKNDNCFVEQKNFPVVRQQVGYLRYDTPAELEVLGELPPSAAVRELLPAPDAPGREGPQRSQAHATSRPGSHALPQDRGLAPRRRERQGRADPALPRAEPHGTQARHRTVPGPPPRARPHQTHQPTEGGEPP
jgi:hypothetical protein